MGRDFDNVRSLAPPRSTRNLAASVWSRTPIRRRSPSPRGTPYIANPSGPTGLSCVASRHQRMRPPQSGHRLKYRSTSRP